MKLAADRLEAQLRERLAPIYLITGDEPLQREEAADAVRRAAKSRNYMDREVFFAERDFDWRQFAGAGASLSLFATKRVLDLRLPTGKPGNGAEVLSAYAQNPAPDTLLLIVSAKLERGGGRWAEALEKAGVLVQVWPVDAGRLPAWLASRMRKLGLEPSAEAAALMAERTEGNLLAAAQEIDKLLLLHGSGPVDAEAVRSAVADSARYDAYKLVDAALAGDRARTAHVLRGLREEGAEPVLVLWALGQEIRKLAGMAWEIHAGVPRVRVLASVWEKRRAPMGKALSRHATRDWQGMCAALAHVDRVIKGRAAGRVWDELLNLSEHLAGLRLPA